MIRRPACWFLRAAMIATLFVLAGGSELRADPLRFFDAYQLLDPSPTRLPLFENQGAVLTPRTFGGTSDWPGEYVFGVTITNESGEDFTDVIRFIYQEGVLPPVERSWTISTPHPPFPHTFILAAVFAPIHRTGKPVPTTLTIDLLNSSPDFIIPGGPDRGRLVDSYTYNFYTQTPIPEPSTLMLVAAGGLTALARVRRRRSATPLRPRDDGR